MTRVALKVLLGDLLGAGLDSFWRFRFDTTHLAGVDDQARGSDF